MDDKTLDRFTKARSLLQISLTALGIASIWPINYSAQGIYQGRYEPVVNRDSVSGLFAEKPQEMFSLGLSERKEKFPISEEDKLVKDKAYSIKGKECMWGKYSAHYSDLN